MIIRKQYKFENAHVVRNCYSERCKYSIHGHSYIIEVFLKADKLDNAGMIVDFGVLKNEVSCLIDSFDHCISVWDQDTPEYRSFVKEYSERYIELPISPSAENMAFMLFVFIDAIIRNTKLHNGEAPIELNSVRVHETATGYAEFFGTDIDSGNFMDSTDLICLTKFSDQVISEWKDPDMIDKLIDQKPFVYTQPEQQVCLNN